MIDWDPVLYTGLGVWFIGIPFLVNLSLTAGGNLIDRIGGFIVLSLVLFVLGGLVGSCIFV